MQDMPYPEGTVWEDGRTLAAQKPGNGARYCVDAEKYCEGPRKSGITILWIVAVVAALCGFVICYVQ